jgi:membrane-bound inhibitor of C-type lysozyme
MIQSGAMIRASRLAFPIAACALAALPGCGGERYSVGLEQTVLAATIDYVCEGGIEMRVERSADARSARVTVRDRHWVLPRADSAAQEKYAEGFNALYLDGDVAMLESDGRAVGGRCQSKVEMPKAPQLRPYDFRSPNF